MCYFYSSTIACSKVTLPKIEQNEKKIYTPEQAARFLDLLADEPIKYRALFNLVVYSGFRRSEMLGLEWKDIAFENSIISVRRTSCYTADRGTYTDTTKTKKSQRSLKFLPVVMDLLKTFKAEQDEERRNLGNKWVETDRLFVKWNGEPQHPNTTYTWFLRFCERNNFRFCDIHSMRHRNNMKTPLS